MFDQSRSTTFPQRQTKGGEKRGRSKNVNAVVDRHSFFQAVEYNIRLIQLELLAHESAAVGFTPSRDGDNIFGERGKGERIMPD